MPRDQDTRPLSAIQKARREQSQDNLHVLPTGLGLTLPSGFLFLVSSTWFPGFLGADILTIGACIVCTMGLLLTGVGLGQLLVEGRQG